MRLAVVFLAALQALPAAAEPPTDGVAAVAAPDKADKMVCTREMPVGSQIPVKRCRTQKQIDLQRDAVQRAIQRPISQKGNN